MLLKENKIYIYYLSEKLLKVWYGSLFTLFVAGEFLPVHSEKLEDDDHQREPD